MTSPADRMPISKHQYSLHQKGYGSHQAICDFVRSRTTVLDVGCASGYLMSYLRENKSCTCIGIEPDPSAAAIAQHAGFHVIEASCETGLQSVTAYGPFDHIVFGDVLEHTLDPASVLVSARGLLAQSGTVVVSLPNVVSLRARLRLAFGNWRYSTSGIFDQTHVRFFSVATGRELLEDSGYSITHEVFVGPLTYYGGRAFRRLNALRPGILGTQMIFEARAQ